MSAISRFRACCTARFCAALIRTRGFARLTRRSAEALPGVIAVLTAADIADLNPIYNGRPVIAMNKVRYVGEPVAAVAAEDLATAEEALALIHVDYEELPTVANIEAAIKPGAPLVHEDKGSNIGTHEKVNRGNADEGFAQSDVIAEDHFTFPMVYHYAMEPHSAIAPLRRQ